MSTPSLVHIADRVLNRPLMILPEKLSLIASILDGRIGIDAAGLVGDVPENLMQPGASRFVGEFVLTDPSNPKSRKPYRTTAEGVAIITVMGSLVNRGAWIGSYSGMTSYEGLKHQISTAAADRDVTAILLDIDSPGGEAVGAFEVADVLRAAVEKKPIRVVANGMAASAAYAIASADPRIEIIVTPSSIVGSIGVVMLHADYSHRMHEAGVVPTLIFAGARKVDGNPYEKLTADVKAELKSEIDRFYTLFVESVAKGRSNLTPEAIRGTEARTFIGADAVAAGLADRVGSFEATLTELTGALFGRRNPAKGATLMADDKKGPEAGATFTQADLDKAVATAVAAEQAKAKTEQDGAVAKATSDATTAERERIKAITSLPEARGREAHAILFATSGEMSAETAKTTLAAIGVGGAGPRAGDSAIGLVIDDKGGKSDKNASANWDDVVAGINKQVAGQK